MNKIIVFCILLASPHALASSQVVTILDCGKDNPSIKSWGGKLYVADRGSLEPLIETEKVNVLKSPHFSLTLQTSRGGTLALKADGQSFSCSTPSGK